MGSAEPWDACIPEAVERVPAPGCRAHCATSSSQRFQNVPSCALPAPAGSGPRVTFASCRGEAINGGFGLVLDGTQEAEQKAKMMLTWDVSNGVRHSSPGLFPESPLYPLPLSSQGPRVPTLPSQ